jgi:hypothetical protein
MKLVSFLFFVSCWILPAVQSHEDGGNLRASQAQMQEHLQQKLDQTLRNLNEEFQGDRELLFIGAICRRIGDAFQEPVDCTCEYKYRSIAFDFKCTGKDRVNVAGGITGVPKYSGVINLNPLQLGYEVRATACLTEMRFLFINLLDLCVGGSQCYAMIGEGIGVPCNICEASYGTFNCACEICTGGMTFDCGDIPFLPSLCIPLPFLRSLRPEPNSIAGLESLEK